MGRKVSNMSVQLARALASGRSADPRVTRAAILAALLRKRSAAANAGLVELEAQIRSQILWALPVERPRQDESELEAGLAPLPAEGTAAPGCARCGK